MMHPIVKTSLDNAMSYQTYRDLVDTLVEKGETTGLEQTESLINYTKMNARRMKRWDKTLKISENAQELISNFQQPITWLVITESWCGDAAHVVPVFNKLAELNKHITLKLVLRDEHPELMDMFLTNGGRAIPKLIMIDDATGDELGTFGPRPSEATALVNSYKEAYGKLTPEFKEELQVWYNLNKGQNIIDDISILLGQMKPTICI